MTLKEVAKIGIKKVMVVSYGYTEGRVCKTYQPFNKPRNIIFDIKPIGDDYYLDHRTFYMLEDEDRLEYTVENNYAYVYDPEIGADIDY